MTSERQGKQAAVALLACMAAVALTLWGWPSSPLRSHYAHHADMALHAAAEAPAPVSARAMAGPAFVSQPTIPDPPPGLKERDLPAWRPEASEEVESAAARPLPAVVIEAPRLEPLGEPVRQAAVVPIASRTLVVAMHPVVPVTRQLPLKADGAGNAFAHAGVALGSAFRRAGVNTGAAFSRIF